MKMARRQQQKKYKKEGKTSFGKARSYGDGYKKQ